MDRRLNGPAATMHDVRILMVGSNILILRSHCIRDLGVMLDSKLYFHCHVDFVHSQTLRTSGLIRLITYNFSSLESLVVLYISLIR
jgi:hypothetical protein